MNAEILKKVYNTMERERIRKEYFGEHSPLKEEEKPQDENEHSLLKHVLMFVAPVCTMLLYHIACGE